MEKIIGQTSARRVYFKRLTLSGEEVDYEHEENEEEQVDDYEAHEDFVPGGADAANGVDGGAGGEEGVGHLWRVLRWRSLVSSGSSSCQTKVTVTKRSKLIILCLRF